MPKFPAKYYWLIVSVFLANSCSSVTSIPTGEIETAESAIENAQEAGAYDSEALHSAIDKLEQAKQAVQAENYQQAKQLAEQASVDAELVEAKAEADTAKEATESLRQSIDTLHQEIEYTQN